MTTIDWDELTAAAITARVHAYAPYSRFPVGAAGLTADGRIVTGVNVENASLGLTLCAECSLVSNLWTSGGGILRAVAVVDGEDRPLVPCGRCRQLLVEHGDAGLRILTPAGERSIAELLPEPFGPGHLAGHTQV